MQVKLTKLQAKYLKDAYEQKMRIERDISVAIGMALAGHGVDTVDGMTFGMDGAVLHYELPKVAE